MISIVIRDVEDRCGPSYAGLDRWGYELTYTGQVEIFTKRELRFVEKLRTAPVDTTLELCESCPVHSVCTPLPLFSIHRGTEETFVAEWNTCHRRGTRQVFRFDEIDGDQSGSTR